MKSSPKEKDQTLFDQPKIRKFSFEQVPLNQDIYLMDEKWMREYEQALTKCLEGGKYETVGYISYAAARSITGNSIELSWYPNTHDRFHEMKIWLPKEHFRTCVDSYEIDEKPRIFVKSTWLAQLHLRTHSVFAMIDAIGVKSALANGKLKRKKLIDLQEGIDALAKEHPDMAFISFADSLLVKSNWSVGQYNSRVKYTYAPETILRLLKKVRELYQSVLGLGTYSVLTQGINEYYKDELLHISATKNHLSLNSLGLPFAQLLSIEAAVRKSIKQSIHKPEDLYLDEDFYHSLRFKFSFEKSDWPKYDYQLPMGSTPGYYFANSLDKILDNLEA